MMFKSQFHPGIVDGSVTRTYRYWKRPQAVVDNFYRINPIGHIHVQSVKEVNVRRITNQFARESGFDDARSLKAFLSDFASSDRELYEITFTYVGHQQSLETDRSAVDAPAEIEKIRLALAKKDRNSASGPWTEATLRLIDQEPGLSSTKMAVRLGRQQTELKRDVRKLKTMGLTISLETGYQLSEKGRSYLSKC